MPGKLPEQWLVSVVCCPLAVFAAAITLHWSPWGGALVLTLPALLLLVAYPNVMVVASYLLGATAAAAGLIALDFPSQPELTELTIRVIAAAALAGSIVTLLSSLACGQSLRRWSVLVGLGVPLTGLLLATRLAGPMGAVEPSAVPTPEVLGAVPPCSSSCALRSTPSGHLRCSTVTENKRMHALRECDSGTGFLHVRADGHETSVLVENREPAVVWREPGGKLVVEQGGTPLRALSPEGAVLLSSSFARWPLRLPPYVMHVVGSCLLLVGVALTLVLRSLRAQRALAGGLAGHVEGGRFFPRDGQLAPVATGLADGPALLFGASRAFGYRDRGSRAPTLVAGTEAEIAAQEGASRLRAWSGGLTVALFALVSVAADLARLH